MKRFKILNNIVGWVVFAIAAATYLLTIEPSASFWDCGEFISSAAKLEVGHPPGAPFFIMTGRIFALFASDPTQIAAMVNSLSALCSAFCILFLFWTITHIARRIVMQNDEQFSAARMIAVLGAGAVGALAYTFSDTFWFSAVEGEVYGYSSFFTAIVFWAILKWEDNSESSSALRWIVLIAYLMGLSIGVHLLNLLTIPAIVLVYYFKKYTPSWKGILIALASSCLILLAVLYGLIPGCVKMMSYFELIFVNGLHCPFNTGVVVYLIVLTAMTVWTLVETTYLKRPLCAKVAFIVTMILYGIPLIGPMWLWVFVIAAIVVALFVIKNINYKWLNFITICAMVIMIGYSSYAMIVVRSMANTPMDQNSPEDVFTLQSYLNREQYGDRPLFYGPVYSAPEVFEVKGNLCIPIGRYGNTIWQQKVKESENEKDRYISLGKRQIGYETDKRFNMLLPRMYSSQSHHVEAYKAWTNNASGTPIQVDMCGHQETRYKPTMAANLHFLFSYQLNFMYWRYFMWNFAGRQNDLQSHGEIDKGNWISGIDFIDNARLGDQSKLPDVLKNNRGHNRYFLLPLLLGLLGLVWQLSKKRSGVQNFWVVFVLFFMTGIAIVLYLNQTPYQPRERDYAYAGSFYAFAIWIGLGVMFFYELIEKVLKNRVVRVVLAVVISLVSLGVPALMAQQNWDDHDRSNRMIAHDFGLDYLNTCPENAIIFCNGDNDTFPLWYNQEVEGNRTDVRVCNLSYANTDWYIDQMKRQAYDSEPLPIEWEKKDYAAGKLEACRVNDNLESMDVTRALALLQDPRTMDENGIGNFYSRHLTLPVDRQAAKGSVNEKDTAKIVGVMDIPLGRTVNKAQLLMLELLRANNWERPIYVASTVGDEYYLDLKDYMQLEGLAYRIVPVKGRKDRVNTDAMYDNLMNKFVYGNVSDPKVYLDEQHQRMCRTMRTLFAMLAGELADEDNFDKVVEVVDKSLEVIPIETVPADYNIAEMASYLYDAVAYGDMKFEDGEVLIERADDLIRKVAENSVQVIEWNLSMKPEQRKSVSSEFSLDQHISILRYVAMWAAKNPKSDELYYEIDNLFQEYAPYHSGNRR